MPRKIRDSTEPGPPAETGGKIRSNETASASGHAGAPAPRGGPAPVRESPPESSSSPKDAERFTFGVHETLTLSQLRYFMAVCDTLSFTHAARKCGISQPALLRAIRKLENSLGAQLFRLEPARLRPTELAQLLRPQLQMILTNAEAAKEAAGKFAAENPMLRNQKRKKHPRKD